jgi:hypothetical protein
MVLKMMLSLKLTRVWSILWKILRSILVNYLDVCYLYCDPHNAYFRTGKLTKSRIFNVKYIMIIMCCIYEF